MKARNKDQIIYFRQAVHIALASVSRSDVNLKRLDNLVMEIWI